MWYVFVFYGGNPSHQLNLVQKIEINIQGGREGGREGKREREGNVGQIPLTLGFFLWEERVLNFESAPFIFAEKSP